MISNELLKKKIIEHYLYEVNYKKQQLKEIAEFKSGKTPQSTEICKSGNIPYYKVSDMNLVENKVYMNKNINYLREIGSYKLFPKHSIIFPKNGGALLTNKKRILTVDSLVDLNTGVLIPNEKIFYKYLYYFMLLVDFKYYFKGTALPTIDSKKFLEIIMPVPPLEEQKKIVKKIEELFELIDKKEKNDKEKDKLKTLLKEKILDSAIHGELVENDLSLQPDDVEEIKEDIPFKIPNNWKWTKIKHICKKIIDGDHNPPKGELEKTDYIMLSAINIIDSNLDTSKNIRYLNKDNYDKCYNRINLMEGDVLLSSVGTIGKTCIFSSKEKVVFQRSVTILSTKFNKYLKYYLDSPKVQKYMNDNSLGAVQNGFYLNKVKELFIPIPPLEQQKKIVKKIEECFKLIEQL